ncbi:MAG: phosphate signaling complex protein PhoU [Acidimicrobiia bacterium]|nr:phosphate signaling complex protein PhoU [Acidimicrobiia bacterium]
MNQPEGYRKEYHRQMNQLKADILRLGGMVIETIPRGTQVLLTGDLKVAKELIAYDSQIDKLSIDVEDRVYLIIARQAPAASELRHLVTISKLVAELERSADLMVNVSKAARRMYGSEMSPRIRGVASSMAKEAQKLLQYSLDAYADSDESLAAALDDIDDALDALNVDMVEAIFAAHTEGSIDLQAAVQLALVARYYERIGDHAVNIGQRVIYMVTGWMPEHDDEMSEPSAPVELPEGATSSVSGSEEARG